jgi:protein-disulfide isomerase
MPKRKKKSAFHLVLLSAVGLGALFASSYYILGNANAQDQNVADSSGSFSETQRGEIQQIFRDYLMENPEMISEAMIALREKQEREMEEMTQNKLKEYAEFFQSDDVPFVGKKDGDVTVVEFFDYNCGYCKRAFEDVQALIERDKNVRVVFIEMPILGPTSFTAAQWAMAAHKQGKYFEFHQALMEHQGGKDEAQMKVIAERLGLDVDKMAADAKSDAVQELLGKSIGVARDMGIQGTPAFIVGDQVFRGYIGTEALIESVKQARG